MITDKGIEIVNKKLKEWVQQKQIIHNKARPYYHQSNSRIEEQT